MVFSTLRRFRNRNTGKEMALREKELEQKKDFIRERIRTRKFCKTERVT